MNAKPDADPEAFGPGRAGDKKLTREQIDALISQPSPLRGFQEKKGMVNPVEWMPEVRHDRRMNMRDWRKRVEDGTVGLLEPLPTETTGCQVLVNHDYRFFWIKTRKTGGTSLKASLGFVCEDPWGNPKHSDTQYCSSAPWRKPVPAEGDPETWWKEYFVFTTVRNPYSHFASGHSFSRRWNCMKQTFGEGCRNPFLLGDDCSKGTCCRPSVAYLRHVREHTSCMFTKDGELAVDFISQTENIDEDFPIIIKEINKRRRKGVPALSEKLPELNRNKNMTNGYTDLFVQYPECIGLLNKVLENEFKDLQYM